MSTELKLKSALDEIDRLIYKIKQPESYLNSFFNRITHCFKKKFDFNKEDEQIIENILSDCLKSCASLNLNQELELLLVLKSKFNAWSKTSALVNKKKLNDKLTKLKKLKYFITQSIFNNKFNQIEKEISKLKKKYNMKTQEKEKTITNPEEKTQAQQVVNEKDDSDDVIYIETTITKTPLQLPTIHTIRLYNQAKRLAHICEEKYKDSKTI